MKTTTAQAKTLQAHHIITILVGDKRFLLTILFMFMAFLLFPQGNRMKQQNGNMGISLSSQVTADGYGTQFLPMLHYRKGRATLFVGPAIQKQKLAVTGVESNFTYSVSGKHGPTMDELELFFFVTAAYHRNALLGKCTLRQEELADPTFQENHLQDLRFSSAEAYTGVGLRVPFGKKFNWTSSIGIGGYYSQNFPGVPGLYYNAQNIGLLLRTGIMMDL
jgi:hypothetical protein